MRNQPVLTLRLAYGTPGSFLTIHTSFGTAPFLNVGHGAVPAQQGIIGAREHRARARSGAGVARRELGRVEIGAFQPDRAGVAAACGGLRVTQRLAEGNHALRRVAALGAARVDQVAHVLRHTLGTACGSDAAAVPPHRGLAARRHRRRRRWRLVRHRFLREHRCRTRRS